MRSLSHRGPDDESVYERPGIALGHRRLSIIDIDGGQQPVFNEDRSVALVFNGEIYNYVELRSELQQKGHRLASHSDTEVIAHLYEEHGADCVIPLNGMFAFALWDEKERQLLLARDRLGEKPLYYSVDHGTLHFASELKALLHLSSTSAKVSLDALDDYFAYGYIPGHRSIFDGVHKLPPGHRLLWRAGELRVEKYWDVDGSTHSGETLGHHAWLEALEDRLRASIRMRLRSDVPLGVFLSGGIDSSLIVALAAEESGKKLKTFSVGFREADFDELSYARTVAERFDTEHCEMTVGDADVSILPELAHQLDEPLADPSVVPTYYICREARRHVTVCLSGDGGDEVFGGYDRYVQALRYGRLDEWVPRGVAGGLALAADLLPRYIRGRGVLERLSTSREHRYFQQAGKFSVAERRALYGEALQPHLQEEPWAYAPYFADSDLLTTLQRVDQKTYLPDDILVKVDRMSMRSSLEVRVPLLDHTLVEFANRAPASYKLRGETTKLPLRNLLARKLPESISGRGKRGFGIPIRDWYKGDFGTFVRDLLLSPGTRVNQWLKPEAVQQLLRDEERGQRDLSRKVWMLTILELWCRAYKV